MLETKVENTIEKYNLLNKEDKVIVCVSGGPDSMTLLSILLKIREKYDLSLVVAHVNHMIRENAKKDEEYVIKYCKKYNIEYFIKRADVIQKAKNEKKTIEEAGREVRYNFFDEVLSNTKSNKIAVAHNLNDYCETIIMNELRGCGISGLKGIDAKRGNIIRPLIEISRKEIEEYCEIENLEPRHDESNDDSTYTRNKIRNVVIPYLQNEFNPNIINSLKRLSEIIRENENFISNETLKKYKDVIVSDDKNIVYNLKKFNNQDILIQKRLILLGVEKLFGTTKGIEKINLDDIVKMCNNNIGNKYLKPNKLTKIEIRDKKIIISKDDEV